MPASKPEKRRNRSGSVFLPGTRKLEIFYPIRPCRNTFAGNGAYVYPRCRGMGVSDCELRWTDAPETLSETLLSDGILARASLNVYSPEHPVETT